MPQKTWTSSCPVSFTLCCALGAYGLGGCGEIKKAGECATVIEVFNEASKIEAKPGKDDLSEEIKAMEEIDGKIGKLEVTDAGLKKHVDDYRALLKSMVENMKAADKIAKDADKITDPAAAAKLQKEMEGLEKKMETVDKDETKIVDELNAYCNRK